ncbi:MAG: type II secretion system protein [Phycisphaeraceae bacterium]|nr:type II secretion system protein [Phycisphaeraceae bacterium]
MSKSVESFYPQRKAFTLIELLVVISIISLLIAVLLPALASARKTAQAITCASSLRQIGLAGITYSSDFDGYYPIQGVAGGTGYPTTQFFNWWAAYFMAYTGDGTFSNAGRSWGKAKGIWDCPTNTSVKGTNGMATNYVYNSEMGWNFTPSTGVKLGRPSLWHKTSDIIYLADAARFSTTANRVGTQAGFGQRVYVGDWHLKTYNAVYLDGHIKRLALVNNKVPSENYPQGLIWLNKW